MNDKVTLIDDQNNCQVVQVAGRRHPGVVVQGDSLSILVELASEVVRFLDVNDINEAKDTASELHGLLSARLQVYTDAMHRMEQKNQGDFLDAAH